MSVTSIIIKEIDRFKSLNHKGRTISEFIIYTMADEIIVSAMTIIDSDGKANKFMEFITPPDVKITRIPYENK